MREFRVWAPKASRVDLRVGAKSITMKSEPGGWWSAHAVSDADYGFILDGSDVLPDPRSPWQPNGVHGLSRVVDFSAFQWTDAQWQAPPFSSAVIYELHVGTFTAEGTLDSAIPRLGHLVQLGITHIELMPLNEFPGDWGWGYDGADLFAPHNAYGGPAALNRFVDACHAAGLAVIIDVVYNHLGPTGNYLDLFGPYFTDRYSTPWGRAVNFDDAGSDEVRRFFCDNAWMWLRDYHADGLRIDAIHAIFDASAVHFLEQLSQEVSELEAHLGRRLTLIAESDLNNPRVVTPRECGGFGIDAQWNDDFHHALHTVLTGERNGYYADFGTLEQLAKALRQAFVYDGIESQFRGRRHGRPPEGTPGWRFVAFLQNHDQVGNRAQGERSGGLMSSERAKIGAALLMCAPFVPMIFQGEEFGARTPFLYFTHHRDPGVAAAVSAGRRREFAAFGWQPEDVPDPQDRSTFLGSKLDWNEAEGSAMLEWHRQLIVLRKRTPELTDGRMDQVVVEFSESERWFMLRRGNVVCCANLGETRRFTLPFAPETTLVSNCAIEGREATMPADSVVVAARGRT
jgi:maltooligosyltrehalose trehalohydrolase